MSANLVPMAPPNNGDLTFEELGLEAVVNSPNRLHHNSILAPRRGGRHSLNGDPQWTAITKTFPVDEDAKQKLDFMMNHDIKEVADEVSNGAIGEKMVARSGNGGGWSLSGSKEGKRSAITGDITWKFRCRSHHAFQCPAAVQIIYRKTIGTLHLETASAWDHKHEGTPLTQIGLPPSVKVTIDSICQANPNIKCKGVKNMLWEVHGLSKDLYDSKVETYFYKGSTTRRNSLDVTTGISSYGTAVTFAEGNGLIDRVAAHTVGPNSGYLDVAGVIGYYADPPNSKCFVLVSTCKMLIEAYIQSTMGYSDGQLHADYTFKLLQEQIPFFVASVPDIRQHVHMVALGPCTHQDTEMVARMLESIKAMTEKLVCMIATETGWPDDWSSAARDALRRTYTRPILAGLVAKGLIDRVDDAVPARLVVYKPARFMADSADALGNAARIVWPDIDVNMCWVHVWRAVKNKHHLLNKDNEDTQAKLYSDLNFIHVLTEVELIAPAWRLFEDKWRELGEDRMVDYIVAEWKPLKWQRAHGAPGEPSDNNTLESLNRLLKTDSAFAKTTSLGLCLTSCLVTAYRLSRDAKPMVAADAPVAKKDEWVKAQKLVDKSHFKLEYKLGESAVIPSEKLISQLPGRTVAERRTNMNVWVKEYVAMMKNPGTYYKVHGPNGWDFDTLMDYASSFYVLTKITGSHAHMAALASAGVMYKCNCPQFMHYHYCKHAIGYAMHKLNMPLPVTYSTQTVGKRSAPPGAKLTKRAKCLAIDN